MANTKAGTKKFVLSTSGLNSYGFRILTEGADLEQFKKNPVMLFNHSRDNESYTGPVGRWLNIAIDGDTITAESEFDMNDAKAAALADKVENGFLRAASFGIKILETSDAAELMLPGQLLPTVTKWKAVEASVCDIPSNDDSLILYNINDERIELTQQGLVNFFTPLHTTTTADMELLQHLNTALNLSADAKQSDALTALQHVANEHKTLTADNLQLKAENEALHNELVDGLVQLAIEQKKISAHQKPLYVELMKKDFDNTRKLIDGIKPAINLAQAVQQHYHDTEDRSLWTLNDYRQRDPRALEQMRVQLPAKFQQLLEAFEQSVK